MIAPMNTTETPMDALDQAIDRAGGVVALSSRIDVATSSPSMWRHRKRVPAEHCPAIERETGVLCERLRPDIPWAVLREQVANAD